MWSWGGGRGWRGQRGADGQGGPSSKHERERSEDQRSQARPSPSLLASDDFVLSADFSDMKHDGMTEHKDHRLPHTETIAHLLLPRLVLLPSVLLPTLPLRARILRLPLLLRHRRSPSRSLDADHARQVPSSLAVVRQSRYLRVSGRPVSLLVVNRVPASRKEKVFR